MRGSRGENTEREMELKQGRRWRAVRALEPSAADDTVGLAAQELEILAANPQLSQSSTCISTAEDIARNPHLDGEGEDRDPPAPVSWRDLSGIRNRFGRVSDVSSGGSSGRRWQLCQFASPGVQLELK